MIKNTITGLVMFGIVGLVILILMALATWLGGYFFLFAFIALGLIAANFFGDMWNRGEF